MYGYYSYRPWAKVDAASGRLQMLRNRVPLQWRVPAGLTELDEATMTPSQEEWEAALTTPLETEGPPPPPEVQVLLAMSTGPIEPPESRHEARIRFMEPLLSRLARSRMVRASVDLSGNQLDAVVRHMTWRAWFASDCLAASIDAMRVAQGHTLLRRDHTGDWWTESAALRVLEPRVVECAREASPERLREAADALLRIDDEREAFVVNLETQIASIEQVLGLLEAEVRNVWIPHLHVDPMLEELELRLRTAEGLADTGSLLDVMLPRQHPQWEELRIERDREIQLRIEYRLLAASLRLIAGDEPDVVHPLSEEPVEHDAHHVFWDHPYVDPEGFDEVVVWNPEGLEE